MIYKKFYITGCAKSGTTLLLRMFYSFAHTKFLNESETPINKFAKIDLNNYDDNIFLVGKRSAHTIFSHNKINDINKQIKIISNNNIFIINIIRDGRDVILSDNCAVKPIRWIESMRQSRKFSRIIGLQITYEDLINEPDKQQDIISKKCGLKIKNRFSEYPKFVPDCAFNFIKTKKYIYSKRKLSTRSINKNISYYKNICDKNERKLFEKELQKSNYLG